MIKDIADSIKRIDKDNPWKTGKQYFSSRKEQPTVQPTDQNPDPRNFKVEQVFVVGPHIVAVIRYPNCTNYEGLKVMLFKNLPLDQFSNLKWIDPHFCDGKHVSPFARFEPTQTGVDMAVFVAKNLV